VRGVFWLVFEIPERLDLYPLVDLRPVRDVPSARELSLFACAECAPQEQYL
jgi:hypothetical protein